MPNTPTRLFGRDVTNESSPNARDSRHVIKGYWGSSPSPSPIPPPRALSAENFPESVGAEAPSDPIPLVQATASPGDIFQFKTPLASSRLSPSSSNVAASVSMDDVPLPVRITSPRRPCRIKGANFSAGCYSLSASLAHDSCPPPPPHPPTHTHTPACLPCRTPAGRRDMGPARDR